MTHNFSDSIVVPAITRRSSAAGLSLRNHHRNSHNDKSSRFSESSSRNAGSFGNVTATVTERATEILRKGLLTILPIRNRSEYETVEIARIYQSLLISEANLGLPARWTRTQRFDKDYAFRMENLKYLRKKSFRWFDCWKVDQIWNYRVWFLAKEII